MEGVDALGDVTEQAELTPVAIAAACALGNRFFGTKHPKRGEHLAMTKTDYQNIPTVVFSRPEVGTIGLTERQAEKKSGKEKLKVCHTAF